MYLMILVLHVKTGTPPPPCPPPHTHRHIQILPAPMGRRCLLEIQSSLHIEVQAPRSALPFPFTLRPGFPP